MLNALSVRNIVLIDQLDLALDAGMTVLTGETGAGKSILLDALTLALGGRGDASLVRQGQESGQVVAVVELAADHPARALLRDNAIPDDEDVILRRVQFADGRTRAFINDQPVSASLLQKVGSQVVEIHGQHDDRALVDVATHRAALDAFGELSAEADAVRDCWAALVEAQQAVTEQRALVAEAVAAEDYARHTVEELSKLNPVAGEEEELAERRQQLQQAEKAASDVVEIDEILNGPNAPSPALASLMRRLMRKIDGGAELFQPIVDALDASLTTLDRTGDALEDLKREMAFDPAELEDVEERLFALRAAARKHQTDCDGLADVLAKYAGDLETLQSGETRLKALEAEEAAARARYREAADILSAGRQNAASALSKAVEAELPDLKLGAARFIVDHQADGKRVSAAGYDQIAFHVQTNPGTAAGPLLKVASGGELSRFLLALKVVLADRGSAPVLIFDEIDTGVGGAVADAIGRRLSRLAKKVQVLTVTHAPQVAAGANRHLLIEKQMVEEGAFVRTHVRPLDKAARQEEVARMLAGAEITKEARAAAKKLLAAVG
ncbi:DNA repair protein RecN (Recombination protein N) [Devosia subaequoris]|uniref:DNA repair protein RecN n=1 Tax=Devosia subaequoris TaxID=395930 RepID=A0A7W6IM07_9HYPH|nr:DNA repair protein RecN [Devosia subaequoris]MBB4051607.1 DNA repair protein RecN (Recombination protein N) [Devosia subaequoris]MCP1209197.1 DNA repair protein RecN [Devosia subaequoris]